MPKKNAAPVKQTILPCFVVAEDRDSKAPILNLAVVDDKTLAGEQKKAVRERKDLLAHARRNGFEGKPGQYVLWPETTTDGTDGMVGSGSAKSLWDIAALPGKLPGGDYALCDAAAKMLLANSDPELAEKLALGWALGNYRYDRYKKSAARTVDTPRLVLPRGLALRVSAAAEAQYLARDLINTPAADLGPEALCQAGADMGKRYGAKTELVTGKKLEREFPAVHTVGKAAALAPCFMDLRWGSPENPEVVLIGKGITFDSGGLDIKSADGMLDMKKDMGGAATVLGLAERIMQEKLPVRLRVLIPSAENAIAGNAFRPRDIIRMRSGLTVEITNTDAEGRLVLSDALAYACEGKKKPALVIDFATLTGAARVALGPELPALFSNDDKLAEDILAAGRETEDPLWRLPLWSGYESMLDSKNADMVNSAASSFAGSITAALFLQKFVTPGVPWAHIDTFAWNKSAKAGRPEGGEPLTMRAVLRMLEKRFPKTPRI